MIAWLEPFHHTIPGGRARKSSGMGTDLRTPLSTCIRVCSAMTYIYLRGDLMEDRGETGAMMLIHCLTRLEDLQWHPLGPRITLVLTMVIGITGLIMNLISTSNNHHSFRLLARKAPILLSDLHHRPPCLSIISHHQTHYNNKAFQVVALDSASNTGINLLMDEGPRMETANRTARGHGVCSSALVCIDQSRCTPSFLSDRNSDSNHHSNHSSRNQSPNYKKGKFRPHLQPQRDVPFRVSRSCQVMGGVFLPLLLRSGYALTLSAGSSMHMEPKTKGPSRYRGARSTCLIHSNHPRTPPYALGTSRKRFGCPVNSSCSSSRGIRNLCRLMTVRSGR